MIEFTITDQQPLPKQRPIVNTRTRRAITPSRTKDWEQMVGWQALFKMRKMNGEPLCGDVALELEIRRKGNSRADIDNLIKSVLDGMNGIVYHDDQQVVQLTARLEYGCDEPGIVVKAWNV